MRKFFLKFVFGLSLLALSSFVQARDMTMPIYKGSADLERMKGLIGAWQGFEEKDGSKEDVFVEYSVSANGSIVVEKLFPGTSKEMMTVYSDKGGKMTLTHYCMLGNQPQMELISSDDKKMVFDLIAGISIDPSKDTHMHSLILNFPSENELTHEWTMYEAGKQSSIVTFHFKRSGASAVSILGAEDVKPGPSPVIIERVVEPIAQSICAKNIICDGPCETPISRIHFDQQSKECKVGSFTGCSCSFVFKDIEECQSVCQGK